MACIVTSSLLPGPQHRLAPTPHPASPHSHFSCLHSCPRPFSAYLTPSILLNMVGEISWGRGMWWVCREIPSNVSHLWGTAQRP